MARKSQNKKSKRKVTSKRELSKKEYFRPETRLSRYDRKYCSCLVQVRTRQSKHRTTKAKRKSKIKKEVNPYAICSYTLYSRIGKKKPIINCGDNYKWESLTLEEIQAFANEKGIPIRSKKRNGSVETPKTELIRRVRKYLFGKDTPRNKRRESKILKKNKSQK